MASAYGGVIGALTASLGLLHRQRSGRGQSFEVPLADAVMSAMALLIVSIEGQPQRYNYPLVDDTMMQTVFPILRDLRDHLHDKHIAGIVDYLKGRAAPGLNFYECSDGRILFVCAVDHIYQTRALLETIGVYDRVIAEGMIAEKPIQRTKPKVTVSTTRVNSVRIGGSACWKSFLPTSRPAPARNGKRCCAMPTSRLQSSKRTRNGWPT